ncbi:winged helix-turn-helix transcriptional regulator [Halopelagius longus]|uniref:Transcriptional regulator n=1 Tax=Halopelagius longus TaxID=1236180 RepID=A0A1H0Z6D7_9EURY|nr:helix-turn-helix domain-containing protein [Halopelagius longus]RDI72849.1 transcriptional regulator [Halopelagius longus]SDQ22860.1 transcriptional regulator, HxlR family [Halopelagius longus]
MDRTDTERAEFFRTLFEELPAPAVDVDAKADFFNFLGRAHMISILHFFAVDPGPWRFNELRKHLDVPPTTLTDRLRELTAAGLVNRRSYDEIPPRVEYSATERSIALKPTFRCLSLWVEQHDWEH